MKSRHLHSSLLTFITTAVVLTGCSGNPHADQGELDTESPLAEYFAYPPSARGIAGHGWVGGHKPAKPSSDEILRLRRIEESVAACMRDEGFEYIPTPPEHDEPVSPTFDDAYALDPEPFAEQYGYGLTTITFSWEANRPPAEDDPNAVIRDGLSDSARDAYDVALWGRLQEHDDDAPTTVGCHDRADAEATEDSGPTLDEISDEFDPLLNDVDALTERVRRDPRVEQAVDEWRQCMTEHGYLGFDELDGPYWSIYERAMEASVPEEGSDGPDSSDTGVVVEGDTRAVIPREQFAQLKRDELELARVDLSCRHTHESTYRDVAIELERAFVEDHREELERYRAFQAGS